MILCTIASSEVYKSISPLLGAAIGWLQNHYADEFVRGSAEIPGTGIVVKSEEPAMLPREKVELEAHRRYIDIHVPLKSEETIGWAPVSALKHPRGEYDPEKDVLFYGDAANRLLHVKVGQMAVFFPDDAHAPNIGLGNHRKLCIKIPV